MIGFLVFNCTIYIKRIRCAERCKKLIKKV